MSPKKEQMKPILIASEKNLKIKKTQKILKETRDRNTDCS